MALVLLLLSALTLVQGGDVVVLLQGGDGAGYFPLAGALSSVARLAVEHLDEAAAPGGNITISTEAVDEGIGAVAALCVALDGDEDTVAVRKKSALSVWTYCGSFVRREKNISYDVCSADGSR